MAKANKAAKSAAAADETKAAKRKARLEAIKNRPAGQRANSKSIDVIEGANGTKVTNYGHVVKAGNVNLGVLVTSVATDAEGNILSTSTTFVAGEITIKAKKGHGNFSKPKHRAHGEEDEEEAGDGEGDDNED
jgi:hypothetical protein